jgi:membrane protease YdiL (CAAX protease family)
MARFERRAFGSYGLALRSGFLRRFAVGAVWGIIPLAAFLVGLHALHVADFAGSDVTGPALVRAGILYAIAFILTGLFEESAMRGYPLYTLMRSVGFWPAAVITSALFALVHVGNSGEAIVGLIAVFVVGMIFCLMVRRTGDLWFAIGNHFAWDYGETFIFGVPDSGTTASGHLLTTHLHGSRWLTGGSVGPEGSVLVFVVLGVLALAFHFAYPRAKLVSADTSGAKALVVLEPRMEG